MKKFTSLLIICIAVLCFFTSCEELEKLAFIGTWKIDVDEGSCYSTYKVAFSETDVQIIKTEYKDRWRRRIDLSGATELMPYTIDSDDIITVSHSVGVMKEIDVTDTFTLDTVNKKLIWKKGEDILALDRQSYSATFTDPSGFEQYSCEHVWYNEPGEEMDIHDSNLFLYSNGQYKWEGEGRTISEGNWTKDGNKVSLNNTKGYVFSRIDFEYVVDSSDASHLKPVKGVPEDMDFTQVSYDYAWCTDRYR